jgi:hypothetical protein
VFVMVAARSGDLVNTSLALTGVAAEGNTVTGYGGGGIYVYMGGKFVVANNSLTLSNCTVTANTARDNSTVSGAGAGLFMYVAGSYVSSTMVALSDVQAVDNAAAGGPHSHAHTQTQARRHTCTRAPCTRAPCTCTYTPTRRSLGPVLSHGPTIHVPRAVARALRSWARAGPAGGAGGGMHVIVAGNTLTDTTVTVRRVTAAGNRAGRVNNPSGGLTCMCTQGQCSPYPFPPPPLPPSHTANAGHSPSHHCS